MAMVTIKSTEAQQNQLQTETTLHTYGDAALLLMGALAGASMSKSATKQFRKMKRKMTWQALGMKFKSMFGKKQQEQIMGMDAWLFVLLVLAVAALGFWAFGVWGFLVLLGLGAIIYLLLKNGS
jgi:hypothetical protein